MTSKLLLNGVIHAAIALLLQLIVGFSTGNWWAGAALGIGFYWGREKRDFEIHSKDLRWWRGWTPIEYDLDGRNDFMWPFCACLIMSGIITYLGV